MKTLALVGTCALLFAQPFFAQEASPTARVRYMGI
jgi:hypothetical protein